MGIWRKHPNRLVISYQHTVTNYCGRYKSNNRGLLGWKDHIIQMWAHPTAPTHMQMSCINYSSCIQATHPSRCNKSFPVCRPRPLTSLLSATLNKYNPWSVQMSSDPVLHSWWPRAVVVYLLAEGEIFWRDGTDEVGGAQGEFTEGL